MQKNFASFCIVSHGVFHGQNGVNNEISVLYPFYGPFGRSINVFTSHFFNRKVLFFPFLAKKNPDSNWVGVKFRIGFFMDKIA